MAWMEQGTCATLAVKKDHLDERLRVAESELRLAKRQLKANKQREWVFTKWLTDVVLILYALAGYDAWLAKTFLTRAAAKRRWTPQTDDALQRIVEDAFLAVDVDALAGLVDMNSPTNKLAMKTAVKFFEEGRLAAWVTNLNQTKGVAPSSESVLRQYECNCSCVPAEVRPPRVGVSASARARVWAQRWRERWGFRHGVIRPREDVAALELQGKVRLRFGPTLPKGGARKGPDFRSSFWDPPLSAIG